MWFECSECGGHINRPTAPIVCPECGMAGVIFMPADPDDVNAGQSAGDGLRSDVAPGGYRTTDLVAHAWPRETPLGLTGVRLDCGLLGGRRQRRRRGDDPADVG